MLLPIDAICEDEEQFGAEKSYSPCGGVLEIVQCELPIGLLEPGSRSASHVAMGKSLDHVNAAN